MYLNLLILCGVLSLGITESSEEDNIKETFDLHVRKKRLIDLTPEGNMPIYYTRVPYLAHIKRYGKLNCAGSILSPHHILTTNECIFEPKSAYRITTIARSAVTASNHSIMQVINRPGYLLNDLVLIAIYPPIIFDHPVPRNIELHEGPLPQNTIGTISGLQHFFRRNGVILPEDLRLINVPIISNQECANIYQGHFHITDKHICTFDRSQQRRCNELDIGSPLIVFSHLIGILLFAGEKFGINYPDVFINLDNPLIRNRILADIEPDLHNQFNPHNPHHLRYPL